MNSPVTQIAPSEALPKEVPEKKFVWETFQLQRLPEFHDQTQPYCFQQYAVYQALTNSAFLFGLATGTGKTLCSYMAFFYYKRKVPNTKLIILTKKSAVLQFAKELEKFFNVPDMRTRAIGPDMKKQYSMTGKTYADCRKQVYEGFTQSVGEFGAVDILVFNYSVFRSDYKTLFKKYCETAVKKGINLFVIYDEATVFKNMASETFRCVENLSKMASRKVAATATITKGKLEEIYSIFKGIGIQLYPTKEAFIDAHCITFIPPGGNRFNPKIVGYKNIPEFLARIKGLSIVLRKQDVAPYLPKFISTVSLVEHSESQLEMIKNVYSGYLNVKKLEGGDEEEILVIKDAPQTSEDQEQNASNLLNEEFKLINLLSEHGYIKRILQDERAVSNQDLNNVEILSPKTAALIDALNDDYSEEKIVVYVKSKAYLKILAKTLRENPNVPEFYSKPLTIFGERSALERETDREKFYNSPDHNILILNDAGLEALNLQASNTMLVLTMPNTAGDLIQLAGRISRIGSTHTGLSIRYFLTENSQDQDDYKTLQCQLLVMYMTQGESEEGIIDWALLQEHYGVGRGKLRQAVSQDELLSKSSSRLMLANREKRKSSYL